jgi:hypothetical protein
MLRVGLVDLDDEILLCHNIGMRDLINEIFLCLELDLLIFKELPIPSTSIANRQLRKFSYGKKKKKKNTWFTVTLEYFLTNK